ncbi:MAG: pyridoxal-phosphate dependent enzyme [Sulfolobales archaeon]
MEYICGICGYNTRSLREGPRCPSCGAPLEILINRRWSIARSTPSMWRYETMLPRSGGIVTLGEGLTPVRRVRGVLIKDETRNPTRSYVDRGSSVLASNICIDKAVISYSPDLSISLATYLARREIDLTVSVNGPVSSSNEIIEISRLGVRIVFGDLNPNIYYEDPYMIEGFKTISYEIYEQLGHVKRVCIPAEEGVLAYSIARGFKTLEELGIAQESPEIVATTTSHRGVVGMRDVLLKIGGVRIERIDDQDIVEAIIELSSRGIYMRPISATSYAFSKRMRNCVAVITGSEIKRIPYMNPRRIYSGSRVTELQKRIVEVLSRSNEGMTAYEVWKRIGGDSSLRGVYTSIEALVRRGMLTATLSLRGSRKIKLYRVKQ